MLVLREVQREAFRDVRERECVARFAGLVVRHFPRDARRLGEPGIDRVVRLAMQRSRRHGRHGEREMATHLMMMAMLGAGFDEDPQLAWASSMLAEGAPPQALHRRAMVYLDQVAGIDNGHLVRALARIRALDAASLPRAGQADFEERGLRVLQALHPTKFAAQARAASVEVLRHGATMAARLGLPGGAAPLALLAFFLGTGCCQDPMHPWIADVLASPLAGDAKTAALVDAGRGFAAASLR